MKSSAGQFNWSSTTGCTPSSLTGPCSKSNDSSSDGIYVGWSNDHFFLNLDMLVLKSNNSKLHSQT